MNKVSVIIPVHNSSKYILECLNSVVNQTYKNLEIIIVDDNSSDDSIDIVQKVNDSRIKIVRLNENVGVALARNKGIDVSTGDFICFLDSDDYWKLKKIEKQVKFIKNKSFIYSGYEYLKRGRKHFAKVPKIISYNQALKNTTIFTSTVMFNMKFLSKNDIYMPNIKRGQDTACWWKILKKNNFAYGITEPLSIYRVGDKSLSSNKFIALIRTWNLYRFENISFYKRVYYFFCYVFNAVKRRIF